MFWEAYTLNGKKTIEEMTESLQLLGLANVGLKKVDDRHFLLVFSSGAKADEVLLTLNPRSIKLNSITDATEQSKIKAREWESILQPDIRRPATNSSVARRLIGNYLNIRIPVSPEKENRERLQIASEREKRKLKDQIWSGASI